MKKGKTKSFTKLKGIEKKKYSKPSSMTNIINTNNNNNNDSSNIKQKELFKTRSKFSINHEYSKSNILNPKIKSKKYNTNKQNNTSIEIESMKQTKRNIGVYENQIQKENINTNPQQNEISTINNPNHNPIININNNNICNNKLNNERILLKIKKLQERYEKKNN